MLLSAYPATTTASKPVTQAALPPTAQLLLQGGDARIALNVTSALNQYGCAALPDAGLMSFASSTASVISESGFLAADQLRTRLTLAAALEPRGQSYQQEMQRQRRELIHLCGVADLPDTEIVFAASGTDLHLVAAQWVAAASNKPTLAVMVESAETGSGVLSALAGRIGPNEQALEVSTVALRLADGQPRPPAQVDAEFETLVSRAAAHGQRVLLVMVDHSKTGLIAPSPACAIALQQRFPDALEVLVDACQFRIAPSTLRAYLAQDFMVALTGSKFITGPSFSGALFIPSAVAHRVVQRPLPMALLPYATQMNSLRGWQPKSYFARPNFGMMLRWEAALAELCAFHALPETAITAFLTRFAYALRNRLEQDPSFEALPINTLDRGASFAPPAWDQIQTVFPFTLKRRDANRATRHLTRDESTQVYRLLARDVGEVLNLAQDSLHGALAATRFQLGQPVACGFRDSIAVSALRLCVSARMIVAACTNNGKDSAAVIASALAALDKTALLVDSLPRCGWPV